MTEGKLMGSVVPRYRTFIGKAPRVTSLSLILGAGLGLAFEVDWFETGSIFSEK